MTRQNVYPKVGERVRIVGGSSYSGYEANVVELSEHQIAVDVKPNCTGKVWFWRDQIEIIETSEVDRARAWREKERAQGRACDIDLASLIDWAAEVEKHERERCARIAASYSEWDVNDPDCDDIQGDQAMQIYREIKGV